MTSDKDLWDTHWPELIRLSVEITRQEQLAAQQGIRVEEAKRALRDYIADVAKKIKADSSDSSKGAK